MLTAGNVFAQNSGSIEDNIQSIGRVCLAGEPCVGTSSGSTSPAAVAAPASGAAVSAPVAAPQPVVPEVPEAVVTPAQPAFDVASTYQQSCFACHGTGAAGAPEPGDTEAWDARMEKGMEAVMLNVVNGINAMPARGICMTCSDEDLQQLVDYMISQ